MSRVVRLSERFTLIQQTLEELHGRELAAAAAYAGYLQAIQYSTRQSLLRVRSFTGLDPVAYAAALEAVNACDEEHEKMLRSFHIELCVYFRVDPAQALELSKHFEQVVRDICLERG